MITKENREKHFVLLVHGHGGQNAQTAWMNTDDGVKDYCQECSSTNLIRDDVFIQKLINLNHKPGISVFLLHCRNAHPSAPPPTLLAQPLGNKAVRVCFGALPGFQMFFRPLDPTSQRILRAHEDHRTPEAAVNSLIGRSSFEGVPGMIFSLL
ncbi:hypothetical protein PMAYCL1PPCAC_25296 [Pristionchus mayeri]|uniref:Uncharacterized protein n=1 Tax=Pristionchus mayeri TaxID=1317129 RepID=A0AAN5D1J8_9BILA|nr:hypothetical protein PMAYCL1PPCAC_25296 [Pristionchus mayeri]